MTSAPSLRGWVAFFAIVTSVAGCDEVPTAPSPALDGSSSGRAVARLDLSGAASVPPGQTTQYVARAVYDDGSWSDATAQVTWLSSDPSVLTITAGGVAAGRSRGEAVVSASLAGQVGTMSPVFVVPMGTYRLSGLVLEDGVGVSDAEVAVLSGAGAGLKARTVDGAYRIYGVAGDSEITVSKPGYHQARELLDVSGPAVLNFTLTHLRQGSGGQAHLRQGSGGQAAFARSFGSVVRRLFREQRERGL